MLLYNDERYLNFGGQVLNTGARGSFFHRWGTLRSMDMMTLQVPSTRRSTIGDRAFPVAAARAWNSLPPATTAANSLLQFRRETKAQLFRQSFLD